MHDAFEDKRFKGMLEALEQFDASTGRRDENVELFLHCLAICSIGSASSMVAAPEERDWRS